MENNKCKLSIPDDKYNLIFDPILILVIGFLHTMWK